MINYDTCVAGRAAGSLLARDFGGVAPVDSDGYAFIDRDGARFELILTWLRTGKVACNDLIILDLLRDEAAFYQVRSALID